MGEAGDEGRRMWLALVRSRFLITSYRDIYKWRARSLGIGVCFTNWPARFITINLKSHSITISDKSCKFQ